MGKIAIFFILLIAGGMYYFQDAKLSNIQKSKKQINTDAKEKEEKENDPKTLMGIQWTMGTCLFSPNQEWDFEKIIIANESGYKVKACRKFKGCAEESISYAKEEYHQLRKDYRVAPCP